VLHIYISPLTGKPEQQRKESITGKGLHITI